MLSCLWQPGNQFWCWRRSSESGRSHTARNIIWCPSVGSCLVTDTCDRWHTPLQKRNKGAVRRQCITMGHITTSSAFSLASCLERLFKGMCWLTSGLLWKIRGWSNLKILPGSPVNTDWVSYGTLCTDAGVLKIVTASDNFPPASRNFLCRNSIPRNQQLLHLEWDFYYI